MFKTVTITVVCICMALRKICFLLPCLCLVLIVITVILRVSFHNSNMGGSAAPHSSWKGNLNVSYNVGPGFTTNYSTR